MSANRYRSFITNLLNLIELVIIYSLIWSLVYQPFGILFPLLVTRLLLRLLQMLVSLERASGLLVRAFLVHFHIDLCWCVGRLLLAAHIQSKVLHRQCVGLIEHELVELWVGGVSILGAGLDLVRLHIVEFEKGGDVIRIRICNGVGIGIGIHIHIHYLLLIEIQSDRGRLL